MTTTTAPLLASLSLQPSQRPEPTLAELSQPARAAYVPPALEVPAQPLDDLIPRHLRRAAAPPLPELSELQVVRHFTRLSERNYSIDSGFYPLGSCTMKYNPKVHEKLAADPHWAALHPNQPAETVQGMLQMLWEVQTYLSEVGGMDAFTLQPAAGAHGELVGMMMIRAYHAARGEGATRSEVLVPDSAHGTNPASAVAAGFHVAQIPSRADGRVDLDVLRARVGSQTAALMLTNPNTCGLFERDIVEIAEIVHAAGGQLYYDGANLNAIIGTSRPGDMGFDVVHFNLHKTMTTPHGGGGPGTGPVGVKAHLAPFLPVPVIVRRILSNGSPFYDLESDHPQSIGRVRPFYGNVGLLVRAYAYIRTMGGAGFRQVSHDAILNANYLRSRLVQAFDAPYAGPCMHEFVLSGRRQKQQGVRTMDMAKRLIDYGVHPPTVYFPTIVEECLMIEPTETEDRQTLDGFVEALLAVAAEVETNPALVRSAPHTTAVGRIDEARAARQPDLHWAPIGCPGD